MIDPNADLPGFQGTVRLFPLPNVVHFPQVMLPLHIFEPRYRQLVTDSLAGDRLIAMALMEAGGGLTALGSPAIHPIVCVGRILTEHRLPDGRFNLLLRGLVRARIIEEIPTDRLYRTARVELLTDRQVAGGQEAMELRRQLEAAARTWLQALGVNAEQAGKLLHADLSLGALGDILAYALPLPIETKQGLLTECDVAARVRGLVLHLRATRPVGAAADGQAPPRSFPPDFSAN